MKMEQRQYCGRMKNRENVYGQLQTELPIIFADLFILTNEIIYNIILCITLYYVMHREAI